MSMRFIAILALLVAVPCAALSAQGRLIHPTPEYLRSLRTTSEVGRGRLVSGDATLDGLAQRLRLASRLDSIGSLDGDESTVMGRITDATVSRDGRVFVLDAENQTIRVFARDGTALAPIGRRGSGPSDLRSPVAIWVTGDTTLTVVDAALGIKRFMLRDARQDPAILTLPFSFTHACQSGPAIFALSSGFVQTSSTRDAEIEPIIRQLRNDGTIVRAFGSSYPSPWALVRRNMSEGVLACGANGRVTGALSKIPVVRGFDSSGAERWSTRISDFTVGQTVEKFTSRGERSIGLDETRPDNSFIRCIVSVGPRFALVQVGHITAASIRSGELWASLDSYLIDVEDGRAVFVSATLPLAGAMTEDAFVGFENEPYPRVTRLRIARP